MADKDKIGMDPDLIGSADWELACNRIAHDLKSDFIFAPHFQYIFEHGTEALIKGLKTDLKNGKFVPQPPIHIEVPKASRFKEVHTKRRGPSFSRRGSILLPKDRLLYQMLADEIADEIEENTDRTRCFSNELNDIDEEAFFFPTRYSWGKFQKKIRRLAKSKNNKFVLKTDIANCFASINQHTLIQILNDIGCDNRVTNLLENLLTRYTGANRSSRGIIQGLCPSDLLGNFYMTPLDLYMDEQGYGTARYVDDIYIFVPNGDEADSVIRGFADELRNYDLSISEKKSTFLPSAHLITEEPDLEVLFEEAIEEITSQWTENEDNGSVDYGFQINWAQSSKDEVSGDELLELELDATISLFDSIDEYPSQSETIERFCLPIFSKVGSDYAISHVLEEFLKKPSMTQIYCFYLSKFSDDEDVRGALKQFLLKNGLFAWQKVWILASLISSDEGDEELVSACMKLFSNGSNHDAVRAVSAIYAGRFGSHARRKAIGNKYPSLGSIYLRSAVYFASRWFPKVEKANMTKAYGNENEINTLIDASF